jgi:hypothetical protein
MTTRLIDSPDSVGIDPAEVAANPGVIREVHEDVLREVHEDVLRDLMRTPHAIERPSITERADAEHPRRRMCV